MAAGQREVPTNHGPVGLAKKERTFHYHSGLLNEH
jgi:hypothetical protein